MSGDSAATELADAVVGTYDYVLSRLLARLEGLTDEEFEFEPVEGCWTVREASPGVFTMDAVRPEPDPPPLTTIAWRLGHVACHVLGGFATWLRDGGSPFPDTDEVPGTAAEAIAAVEHHGRRFREGMARLDVAGWVAPIGEQFGEHASSSTAGLVLHVLDELTHHAAEVALLRDLYRARARAVSSSSPS